MPIGDKESLASTPETALEPEIPICDPHHYLLELRAEPAGSPPERTALSTSYELLR